MDSLDRKIGSIREQQRSDFEFITGALKDHGQKIQALVESNAALSFGFDRYQQRAEQLIDALAEGLVALRKENRETRALLDKHLEDHVKGA